jgi:uncharacterized protein
VATVTIRIDDDPRDDLEEIARTRGLTLSDLLRGQIDGLLDRGVPMRDAVPHALSCPQRHVLSQQHEVLALLQADDEQEPEHDHAMATVLREGCAGEYGDVFADMRSEMARSECKLLWDILDRIGDNGNSHSPRLPSYRRMLAEYTPIYEQAAKGARGYALNAALLTVDELKRVAEAWALQGRG